MAETMSLSPLYFFFALLALIHLAEKSQGLSIKLIHPFSPESPFYQQNITLFEMIKKFSKRPRTSTQASYINNTWSRAKVVRPVLEQIGNGHLVKLNLGTFTGQDRIHETEYFDFDTGSELIWLQCEDCAKPGNECFPQQNPPYPNSKSLTFQPLIYEMHHPLCYPNQQIDHYCSYEAHYYDGSYNIGILAYEFFSLDSTYNEYIVMGCGIRNKMSHLAPELRLSGLLGMGWGRHSFVNQISKISHRRFSYCLSPLIGHGRHSTFLRFGRDTPSLSSLHRLRIHKYSEADHYYVPLHGISINSRKLNIPPQYFAKTNNGGGCMLDTGSPLTYLPMSAYRILKNEMKAYLAIADPRLKVTESGPFDLCFERYHPFEGYAKLPRVTFHFVDEVEEDVNLVLQPDIAFSVFPEEQKEVVCLLIMPVYYDLYAVIGAQSMANHVFVFDLPGRQVYFGPRDCARNP